jgi:DNA mismatch repair protein MutL
MPEIHRLDSTLIDRIAAGEVVERPASVVKELVENALDAGSRLIEVAIRGGGVESILVRDDGTGMSRQDALLCLERHATSKIAKEEDLRGIGSYGFRGEALPSIASVSVLTLTTSDSFSPEATRVRVSHGKALEVSPAARGRGTDVLVESLFGKTPARRKFLKSPEAEARAVAVVLTRAALSRPGVAFRYRSNDREVFDVPAATDAAARALDLLGRENLGELLSFAAKAEDLSLSGFVTRGGVTFPTRRYQYIYVNGRPVEDRGIARAIRDASREAIRLDRHPGVLLYLVCGPAAVDVNVHPAKTEVRFASGGTVYRLVYHAVLSALLAGKEERRLKAVPKAPDFTLHDVSASYSAPSSAPERGEKGVAPVDVRVEVEAPQAVEIVRTNPPSQDLLAIGQFRESFILADAGTSLFVIDQHAAHERVLFERIRERLAAGRVFAQRLLTPVVFEATPEEEEALATGADILAAAGFELEPLSGRSFSLASLPAEASGRDPAGILRDAIRSLADPRERTPEERRERLAASVACRSAITIRHHLTLEEMRRLLADWVKLPDRFTCPHGRPVVLSMTEAELATFFERR